MKNLFILCVSLFSSFSVFSDEIKGSASDRLLALLKPVVTLNGNFSQKVKDANGKVIQISDGNFTLARPGLLRWETLEPFPQLLTINEKSIWVYDSDLEQATRRPLGDDIRNSPALLLSSDASKMVGRYDITEVTGTDDVKVFSLQPKQAEMGITRFTLAFSKSSPSRIELQDSLGQQTTIDLVSVTLNKEADRKQFDFYPPEGTDVVMDGDDNFTESVTESSRVVE